MKSKINVFMKRKSEDWYNKWSRIREKGRSRYILIYAILLTVSGMSFGIVLNLMYQESLVNEELIRNFCTWRIFLRLLIFFAIGWPLGYRAWNKNEKRFKASGIPD
ncbi:MAG: hypothetical protein GY870_18135 [archaeon]|nr:hypothetical protein [archaeon]